MDYDVFVSCSRQDANFCQELLNSLEDTGLTCWYAPRDFLPEQNIFQAIADAIQSARLFVLVISDAANSSMQMLREIELAFKQKIPIYAVNIDNAKLSPGFEYYVDRWRVQPIRAASPRADIQKFTSKVSNVLPKNADKIAHNKVLANSVERGEVPGGNATPGRSYQVFISYRREAGSSTARLIRSELNQRGFKVFLDVDDLLPGHFDEALLEHIGKASNFVLILTPNSLDHCTSSTDWLRREIEQAIETGRNIVPVMMPGFQFPEEQALPETIRVIRRHQSLIYSNEFFDAMMNKLVSYLK